MTGPQRTLATDLRVVRVDPFDDAGVAAWHAALVAGAVAGRVHAPVTSLTALTGSVRRPQPRLSRELWAAVEGGRTVGALLLELPGDPNTHVAEAEVDVPPEHRGRGIGTALAEHAERRAAEEGRTTLLAELAVPRGVRDEDWPGWRLAARHGLASAHVEDRLELTLPVDPAPLAAHAAQAHAPAYDVVGWTGACPEELVAPYAGLITVMNTDVPMGEVDWVPETETVADVRRSEARRAEQGWTSLVAAAREVDGSTLVGYSVLMLDGAAPEQAQQFDTLVLREHRGHRLGAALKAANLARLQADHPGVRRVQTWTALDNAPMQAVNAAFGFVAVETLHEMQRTS